MLERLATFLREAQSHTGGQGVSSTKVVWFWAGLSSVYCAVLTTVAGVAVYVFLQKADGVYWTAVGALWVNALGFAGSVQRAQHRAAASIALAQPLSSSGTPSGSPSPAAGDF